MKLYAGDRVEIVRRYQAGESPAALAREYGVSRQSISRIMHPPRRQAPHNKRMTQGLQRQIEAAREREAENVRQDAEKIIAARKFQELMRGTPIGERCHTKACVYPAIAQGLCRKCLVDRFASVSLTGSQSAFAMAFA